MLLFRAEEHVGRWCTQWGLAPGAMMPIEQAWRLAAAWFAADRGAPQWRRPPVEDVGKLLASLGLTGEFWILRG